MKIWQRMEPALRPAYLPLGAHNRHVLYEKVGHRLGHAPGKRQNDHPL